MPALRYLFKPTISWTCIPLATTCGFCAMARKRMAFRKQPTTLRRSRRDNGLRLIERTKMDLQKEATMLMDASKSSHHQRMAYQIFRQPRLLHYPQIWSSYTLIAKVLLCTINCIIQQTRLAYYGIVIMESFEKSQFFTIFYIFPVDINPKNYYTYYGKHWLVKNRRSMGVLWKQ